MRWIDTLQKIGFASIVVGGLVALTQVWTDGPDKCELAVQWLTDESPNAN